MNESITSLKADPSDERPQDLKLVVGEAQKAGEMPVSLTASNHIEGQRVAQEAGLENSQEVAELKALASKAIEVRNAFEARVERISSPYVISPELQKTLRIARVLRKPLLLEGEPGTGKTSLAYALAGEEDLPIIHCRGKSTLTAQSAMYEVDYVARLNDATLSQAIPEALKEQTGKWQQYLERGGDPTKPEFQAFMGSFENASKLMNMGKVADVRNYITYGELGEAIIRAAQGEKVILLFDEIDKAKRDFPNDLLDELEHLTMRIRETGEEISAPRENLIVMVTSNHERDLPEPFLRRCVYSYLEFPKPDQMTEIVRAHIPEVSQRLLQSAIDTFYRIRAEEGIQKAPSTSEMLDWINVLREFGVTEVTDGVPLAEALLKTREDLELIDRRYGQEQKKTSEEKLRERRMPDEIISVLKGQRVFSLTQLPGYSYNNPQYHYNYDENREAKEELYISLANAGYQFKATADHNDIFEIFERGIKRVGDCFAITSKEGMRVYEFLKDSGYVAAEYVTSKEPVTFTQVEEANDQFTKGIDSEGRQVYRTKDGVAVYSLTSAELSEGNVDGTRTAMEEAFYQALEKAQMRAEQRGNKKIRI